MQTITAVIPAKNEAVNISRCITSLKWCDRILVISTGSDKTGEIAEKLGAKVIRRKSTGEQSFEDVQRNLNAAIDDCTTDWMLRVDADEVVTEELKHEITRILSSESMTRNSRTESRDKYVAYGIPRKQYFLGTFLKGGDWAYDRLVRLFKPKFCRYDPIVKVHEQFKVDGQVAYLKSALLHYSHPDFKTLLQKFDFYTTLEAKELKESKLSALIKLVVLPPYIFLRWSFYHHGYRDGIMGFVAGTMRAYYDVMLYFKFLVQKNQ